MSQPGNADDERVQMYLRWAKGTRSDYVEALLQANKLEAENQFLQTALGDVLDALEDLMAGGSHTDAQGVLDQYRPEQFDGSEGGRMDA